MSEFRLKGAIFDLDGVDLNDSTLELVTALKAKGIKVEVVSAELSLNGTPAPDIFVAAAERMGLDPKECMVVEDACAGVEAGVNGNFALVLGVNREGAPEGLYARGADLVVSDVGEITVSDIEEWFKKGIEESSWRLDYHGFDTESERLREALTTVGNGYIGTRGAYAGVGIEEDVHYPGTYLAGLFNNRGTEVEGSTIYNNDFVNCPNWLRVDCIVDDGEPLAPLTQEPIRWHHYLDMGDATTHHDALYRDEEGRETRVETVRLVSMSEPHLAAIRYIVTPLNYSGGLTIRSSLDGDVINYGVERYRPLERRHLENGKSSIEEGDIKLESRTTESKITISMRAHNELYVDGQRAEDEREISRERSAVAERFLIDAQEGRQYELEKIVWISTDRPWPIEEAIMPKLSMLRFHEILANHRQKWRELWSVADMRIQGDRFVQRTSRLHAYHLLSTASIHNEKMDVGLPARGLHGEAYRGHIFWDEIFIAPFFNRVLPSVTRSHLLYRYRRLDEAREIAQEAGYKGALYPWQSADTGERESQKLHYNPRSGDWDPDLSHLQRHISIAIAHNIWEYNYTTGDQEFMDRYGLEMLIEIARFWASIAVFDEKDGRYHIDGVMGPDEFHEKYPDASYEDGGFKDNAYTNVMVAWLLDRVTTVYSSMEEQARESLVKRIGFSENELDEWAHIVSKLTVEMDGSGVMSQFAGYRKLKELDWAAYREKYDDIHRMDRILKAEGDSPDNYQVAKQADTLMIWYILTPKETAEVLGKMGYTIDDPYDFLRRNYEYYIKRTSHGSTLSYVVHAAILTYVPGNEGDMCDWFRESMKSDIYDTQGGTTPEAIHCGVMAGTLQIIVDDFAGLEARPDSLFIIPSMPCGWEHADFTVLYRGNRYDVSVSPGQVRVSMGTDATGTTAVRVNGSHGSLDPGGSVTLGYSGDERS